MNDEYSDLKPSNNLARYVKRGQVTPDGRPAHIAFRPREKEDHISTFCLEMLQGDTVDAQVQDLRVTCPLTRKPKDQFALLNVGVTKQAVEDESPDRRVLEFKHVPMDGLESHCGIFGVRVDDAIIHKIIAEETFGMVSAT